MWIKGGVRMRSMGKAARAILLFLLVQCGVLWLLLIVGFPVEVHFFLGRLSHSKIQRHGAQLSAIQLPQSRLALARDGIVNRQGLHFLQIQSGWLLVEETSVSLVYTANTSFQLTGPFKDAPSLREIDPSKDADARSAAFASWQARSAAQRTERLLFIVDGDTESNLFHQVAKNLLTPLAAAMQAWGGDALKVEDLVLALPDQKVGAAMAHFSLHAPFFGKTVWPGKFALGMGLGYHYFEDVVVTPRGVDFWNRLDTRSRDAQALRRVADFIRGQFLQHFGIVEEPGGDAMHPVAIKYISRGNYPPHLQAIRVADTHPVLINVTSAPETEPEMGYNPSAAGRQVYNEEDVLKNEDRCYDRHWVKRDQFMVISGRSSPYDVDVPNLLEATRVGIRMAKVAGARLWFECLDYMLMRNESGSRWERLPPYACKTAFFRDTAMLVNVSDHSIPYKPYDRISRL
ncbi:hypothetical protein KFL_000200280 [Klebsormidium nitens]|uniref:Uncharacterized protein n=1 Tax=Klebsormidium nitens TaxID=105231 RepID=A0A1Y1HQL0_KLENI|nr:hypothetical protein KFL_000200280 [Klebsormidium nitens]|eukprot:GAQ78876.1 hypothetical protein KFL_000200280 [Klebsormidium nitens]